MSEKGYGIYSKGSSGWTSFKKEELQEGDVWDGFQEREEFSSRLITTSAPAKHVPIPITKSSSKSRTASAPVHIPDWSRIYGGSSYSAVEGSVKSWGAGEEDEEEEEEEEEEEIEPPHEWLAKKYARDHKISSFSVCEGAGRTLKGRDISRVRNAVLTKTGFLEDSN
ncbi:unnamed protein product [Cuscuta campestris]|uniref:Senescence regulator S40 n=2 Tax=Cuscuta sect. Cleistogrammica TaxID=1824901 RepID=A0A484K1Y9_9ASTE|nr:hypothetical protein DM860_008702 [Cuscuta australis]VFQ58648.1 unnamed protein product [Cuscuta campestris]